MARVGAVAAGQQPASSDTSREETRIKDWADVVSCCAAGWVGEGQAEGGAGIALPPPGKGNLGTRPCKLTTSASPVGARLLLGTPRAAAPRPRCSPSPAMARGPLLWGQKTPPALAPGGVGAPWGRVLETNANQEPEREGALDCMPGRRRMGGIWSCPIGMRSCPIGMSELPYRNAELPHRNAALPLTAPLRGICAPWVSLVAQVGRTAIPPSCLQPSPWRSGPLHRPRCHLVAHPPA